MEPETWKVSAPAPPSASGSSSRSSLAMVVDRRPSHRPGGCVGIFFQLFDWNRRLANKKFFARKLLPQVRAAKKISKKFAGEDRMPAAKLLLIADENRGGFPKKAEACGAAWPSATSSGRANCMCTPGLVARLMGLESMPPAALHDEPRKAVDGAASLSDSGCYFDGSDTSGSSRHHQELGLDVGGGTGHAKLERRPQKLQKTGLFDRRPVLAAARAGPDALLFNKNVPARSRKRHHKLASPVKSPRLLGRRSSARLMEAATRILEPGFPARNRARCSLSYMAPLLASVEGADPSPLLQRPGEHLNAPLISPCKNCGSLVQVPDVTLKAEEPSVAAEHGPSAVSPEFSNTSRGWFVEAVHEVPVVLKDERRMPSLAIQAKANVQSRAHGLMERKSLLQNELQEQRKPRQDMAMSRSALRQNNVRPNEVILVRQKVASTPKLGTRQVGRREPRSLSEPRDFVAMNRNVSSCSRTRSAPKATDSQRIEMGGNAWDKKSLVRKRRSVGNITRIGGTNAVDSTHSKLRTVTSEVQEGKGTSARSMHGSSQKLRAGDCGSGSKNSGIVSFTFSSPVRNDTSMPSRSVSEKSMTGHIREGISQSGALPKDSNAGKVSYEKVPEKKVDALSALLEQKIRELSCLNQDELTAGDDVRSRSTAAILEELIAALTAARPIYQKKEDDPEVDLKLEHEPCYDSKGPSQGSHSPQPKSSIVQKFQAEEKPGIPDGILHFHDYDQPSPVSILEASFSNDSCLSESFNSTLGHQPQIGFMDSSFDKWKSWELDADLVDCATSTNVRKIEPGRIPLSLDNIFIMSNIDSRGIGTTSSKHNYIREIISNAELIFGSTSPEEPDGKIYSSVDLILLDTSETLFYTFWEGPISNSGFSVTNEELMFKRLLFDCIIEHLDVKYCYCCKIGYKAWVKLPRLTRDKLTQEICKEIRNCRDLSGKSLDEIVEKDMGYMNGKWTDFEADTFEAGVQIENDLLQLLMDETVIDLLHC